MARMKTWGISDEFWALVEPLIPTSTRMEGKNYQRKPGGGRKPRYSNRVYFAAIVYVLRTGIIWNALPREKFEGLGSAAAHRKFKQWTRAGFLGHLWLRGLAEHDEMAGIAWIWEPVDGSKSRDTLLHESVDLDPARWHRRVKTGGRRGWRPFVACRQRGRSA